MKLNEEIKLSKYRFIILFGILAIIIFGYVFYNWKPLMKRGGNIAADAGYFEVAEVFLKMGGISNYESLLIEQAILQNREELANKYVLGVQNPKMVVKNGLPLVYFAASKEYSRVVQSLSSRGADMNNHPRGGKSILILADERNELNAAGVMLKYGTNPNLIGLSGQPIIYHFMFRKKYDLVKVLAENGANLNYRAPSGRTLLDLAYFDENPEMAAYLYKKGVRSNRFKNSNSRIVNAVKNGNLFEIHKLIQQGEDPHILDGNGDSPLSIAVYSENITAVNVLLEEGVDPNIPFGKPLQYAARRNRFDIVKRLVMSGAKVNLRRYPYNYTALHEAACSSLPIIKLLIEKGANLNAGGTYDWITPLQMAERCGKTDIADYLKQKGATRETGSSWLEDIPPLARAAAMGDIELMADILKDGNPVNEMDMYGNTAFHSAARTGKIKAMELLLKSGAKFNFQGMYYRTPLFPAARYGQEEACRFLIQRRSKVNATDGFGETPLHMAAMGNHIHIARLLVAKGAEIDANINNGDTPLGVAARFDAIDVARFLLDKGSNIHGRDDNQRTPLHNAVMGPSPKVTKLLLDRGADADLEDKQNYTPVMWANDRCKAGGRLVHYLIMKHVGKEIRPSFDCDKAEKLIEEIICSDIDLADFDVQMSKAYSQFKKMGNSRKFRRIRKEQRDWLANRLNRCGYTEETFPECFKFSSSIQESQDFHKAMKCLKEDYKKRILTLERYQKRMVRRKK